MTDQQAAEAKLPYPRLADDRAFSQHMRWLAVVNAAAFGERSRRLATYTWRAGQRLPLFQEDAMDERLTDAEQDVRRAIERIEEAYDEAPEPARVALTTARIQLDLAAWKLAQANAQM